MNAKTTRSASSLGATHTADLNPWTKVADLVRQQLAVTTESTGAIFRGSEAMRKIQLNAAHQASVNHAQTAEKLRASSGQPVDLLALQSELMRSDLQGAGQYWQQLASVALQTQMELMASVSRLFDNDAGGGVKSALEVIQAAVPPMANSFFVSRSSETDDQHKAS
jgi:Phasin protein